MSGWGRARLWIGVGAAAVAVAASGLLVARVGPERRPLGAVVYPNSDGGRTMAVLWSDLTATPCATGGPWFRIFDVRAGSILFGEKTLFRAPLHCPTKPSVVFTPEYRGETGTVDAAFLARDGKRVAANIGRRLWLGELSGRGWGIVGELEAFGWADEDRIAVRSPIVHGDEPFAIEVGGRRGEKGEISLWRHPEKAQANRSPHGRRMIYEVTDRSVPPTEPSYGVYASGLPERRLTWASKTIVSDRAARSETALHTAVDRTGGLTGTAIPTKISPTSLWSPSGDRFATVEYAAGARTSTVQILTAAGEVTTSFSASTEVWRTGWVDERRLWMAGEAGLTIRELRTGRENTIALPNKAKGNARIDQTWTYSLFTPASDIPADETDLVRAIGPAGKPRGLDNRYTDPDLGVSFTMPPSWTVRPANRPNWISGYPGVKIAAHRLDDESGSGVMFTTTTDDIDAVIEKLDRSMGVGEPDGPAGAGRSYSTINGHAFTHARYVGEFERSLAVFLITRTGDLTYIFRAEGYGLGEVLLRYPNAFVVLSSIRLPQP